MELGARLRQARLDAGLSQRQLCGEEVTRNMLSQIENGSARPSMDTLRYFAGRLGKPMSYFLDEPAAVSANQEVMEQARQAKGQQVIRLLQQYRGPDQLFDQERYLLETLAYLHMAEKALENDQHYDCGTYLENARQSGKQTIYYTPELERRRLLLCHKCRAKPARELVSALPDNTQELLLRAEAALQRGDARRCGAILEAVESRTTRWHFLRGEAYFALKEYALAAEAYQQAEAERLVYARLEQCYKELEDFKMAYFYACKQR